MGAVTHKVTQALSVLHNRSQTKENDEVLVVEDEGMPTPQDSLAHPEVGNFYVVTSSLS